MSRGLHKLSDRFVRTAKPGRYGDGGGLWLDVKPSGRSWLFRYMSPDGRERWMGLGSLDAVGLARARDLAAQCRRDVAAGLDPIERRKVRAAEQAAASVTFRQAAEDFIANHAPSWRSPTHREQWRTTLARYAFPVIGETSVATVNTDDILRVLTPIWHTTPETARRLRGRIEMVLDAAKARGLRQGENPAAWRGHLAHYLPARGKAAPVQHHAAVPWQKIGGVMAALAGREGIASRALRFLVLTAARSGEVRNATWSEINLESATWTIPGERMKSGKEHRVPVSAPALAILGEMALRHAAGRTDGLVFPGQANGRPLSSAALAVALKPVAPGATVHGFRSSFRDWAADATHYAREIVEQALAHTIPDKTEAAYLRSDRLEKRRGLMKDWAAHCTREGTSEDHTASAAHSRASPPPEQNAVRADVTRNTAPREAALAVRLPTPEMPAAPWGGAETESDDNERTPFPDDEDERLICQLLFGARNPFQDHATPIFNREDIEHLLTSDERVAAELKASLGTPDTRRGWLNNFGRNVDDAFAKAIAAAVRMARGTPAQFVAACERVETLATDLLDALGESSNTGTDRPAVSFDFIRRTALSAANTPHDAEDLRTLGEMIAQLAHMDQPESGQIDAVREAGGLMEKVAELLPKTAVHLRFVATLTNRAKRHPLPETPRGSKDNFERVFLRSLFNDLVMILDTVLGEHVSPKLLPARDRERQPAGLATRLIAEFIRIGAKRIPPSLASGGGAMATDWRQQAVEALERAASLGPFAIASRVKQVRADRRRSLAHSVPRKTDIVAEHQIT
jgi:integrase